MPVRNASHIDQISSLPLPSSHPVPAPQIRSHDLALYKFVCMYTAPCWVTLSICPTGQTDRRTDGRQTNAFSVTLTGGGGQRIQQGVVVVSDITCLKCVHSLETVHQRSGSS